MAKLLYKTRGMSNPKGKPKVYFTCHPQDFAAYFEQVADEILQIQNCAVWYDEEPEAPYDAEEFLSDLGGMQLFVIPVTSRFLYQECRARAVELAYAMEHHIPILPLLQEAGLESEFNRICGDLQLLDKNSRDETAIRYEEKLTKFLSSVLVDDETAAKVRAAFDAYVFLSYRKKDRKYANELMRLIHQNDFCRDIAIWYDEYLTPGESFNEAIREAMEKSHLFTLLVTPNLVNETNYVMTVEYPAAKEAQKPVLPVEMAATDREALGEKYEDIPDCVGAEETEELARRLAEHLKGIAIRENDADPQHLFFIGLAYLAGIDVEVDHERAVSLIQTAAEAGLEEAIEKTVSMYRTGEGVARDYDEAIRWQERLVEVRRKKYEATGGEEDGRGLVSAQWMLGDFWYELRKLTEAGRWYAVMLGTAEELLQQFPTVWVRRDLSVSYDKLGNISRAEGKLGEAKTYYVKGLKIGEQLVEETGTVEARRDLSVSYGKLGDISRAEGNLVAAETYYEKGLKIREQLAEETGTVEARRDLSVSYHKLGDISRMEGNMSSAKAYYEKGLKIGEQLAEETGTMEARRDLSVSYERLGDISRVEGNLVAAKTYYVKSLEIFEQLAEETGTVEARRDLSISYERLGDISRAEGSLVAAKSYYEKSLEICEQLAEETGTVEARRDLSISYGKLGGISRAEGNLSAAESYYAKGLKIREQLAEETGTVEARRDLSISYGKLGDISRAEGNLSAAKTYCEKSLEIREQLSEETNSFESYNDLASSYYKLGVLDERHMDTDSLESALAIWRKLHDASPDNPDIRRKIQIVEDLLKQ